MASTLTVMVLGVSLSVFLSGLMGWTRGQGRIDAESGSQRAVREITMALREAMAVSVDADKNGVTYRLPVTDGNGNYTVPMTWDGLTRRVYKSNGQILMLDGDRTRVLCSGVIDTDPQSAGGTSPYTLFSAGGGTVTRSLTVMVVSRRTTDYNKSATSRSRETIYLRNVPDLYN